jgi:RNA polymerase sigma factor (sigma-70 family)
LGNRDDAEDTVQNVIATFLEGKIGNYEERGHLRNWFLSSIRKKSYNLMKNKGIRIRKTASIDRDFFAGKDSDIYREGYRDVKGMPLALDGLNPEEEAELSESNHRLERAFDLLMNPRRAKVMKLRFFVGLGYYEIADELGIPRGTVMTDIKRGKDTYRNYLEGLEKRRVA